MSDNTRKALSLKRNGSRSTGPQIEERLHKVLAQAGLGSRRALEERIAQGLVKVNGEVAQTGLSVEQRRPHRTRRQGLRRQRADRTGPRADLQQAGRRSDHARRPRRSPDHLRGAAPPQGRALDRRRPPRHQHHRPAAADHRRRAGQRADASVERRSNANTSAASMAKCRTTSSIASRAASRWKTARPNSTRSSASAPAIRTPGSRSWSPKAAIAKCAACGNRRVTRSAASSACVTATSPCRACCKRGQSRRIAAGKGRCAARRISASRTTRRC